MHIAACMVHAQDVKRLIRIDVFRLSTLPRRTAVTSENVVDESVPPSLCCLLPRGTTRAEPAPPTKLDHTYDHAP